MRGSIILHEGKWLWPPPPPPAAPAPAVQAAVTATESKALEPVTPNYFADTMKNAMLYTGGNQHFKINIHFTQVV